MNHEKVFKAIGVAAMVLLLFGLAGWYLFLRGQTSSIEELRDERGFSIGVPSFSGSRGSTFSNIESGQGGTGEGVDFSVTPGRESEAEKPRPPRLWRTSAIPVAGASFVQSGSTTILRYVERSTGHIFDVDMGTGETKRRTNTLRPQIYSALISKSGNILQQSIDKNVLVTFAGRVGTTSADGFSSLEGSMLPPDLLSVSLSPYSDEILYSLRDSSQKARFVRSSFMGTNPTQVATLGTGSWRVHWLPNRNIILSEKAASGVNGSSFYLESGSLKPLVRNIPGLLVLPHPTSGALIYSSDTGQNLTLHMRSGEDTSLITLSLPTVAEKCVWAPGTPLLAYCAVPRGITQNFLDRWYMGLAHTEDTWWKVEGGAGSVEEFFSPQAGVAMDVQDPILDDTGAYLAFINGIDKSLWVLRITE